MKKSAVVRLAEVFLFFPAAAFCSMSLCSYQANTAPYTYATVLNPVFLGNVELAASAISVTPKGSYLDVVEDAWIIGEITQTWYNNITDLYFMKGTIALPERSALVGLMLWDGATPYQARLYPATYANQTVYPDSQTIAAANKNNLCTVAQLSETEYQVKINGVTLGGEKHVRIRYLVANPGAGVGHYQVPVVFNQSYNNPDHITLTLNASASSKYVLTGSQPVLSLSDSSTIMLPYQAEFDLTNDSPEQSVIQLTSFASGAWQGNYLLLNTLIPDSVIGALSHPIETVFLWRWNAPQSFTHSDNGARAISGFGQNAIDQAQFIRQLLTVLTARGQKAGLVHSVENKPPKVFPLAAGTDAGYTLLQAYLVQFDAAYFLTGPNAGSFRRPSWAPQEVKPTFTFDSSRQELLHSLTLSVGLYTAGNGVLHHLIIISAGPVNAVPQTVTRVEIDSILKNVTCDARNAKWRGVDFTHSFASVEDQKLQYFAGCFFPPFEPNSVSLSITHGTGHYTFPLSTAGNNTLALCAKSQTPWDTQFVWTGFDAAGHKTGSVSSKPFVNRASLDSGLVKLWASDPNRLADNREINIGSVYGIVTKGFEFRISSKDSVRYAGSGVAYLADSQITTPSAVVSDNNAIKNGQRFSFRLVDGTLQLKLPVDGSDCVLTVVDFSGRCLLRIRLARFGGFGTYRIPLGRLLGARFPRLTCVRIESSSYLKTFILMQGDLR